MEHLTLPSHAALFIGAKYCKKILMRQKRHFDQYSIKKEFYGKEQMPAKGL
jgi:hypothetical protein